MNTSTHGSSMDTSTHGSTIHRTSMTFQKSEPAKYDYEMPSRSQHDTTSKNNKTETSTEPMSNNDDVPRKAADETDETNETPFWESPSDDDSVEASASKTDDDAKVDTFFAKIFKRAEGKEDAFTTTKNDDGDATADTFFAKLFKTTTEGNDENAFVSAESTSSERNYEDFVQYMDFLELLEFMNVIKNKTSGMPPQKFESKVEQLEKLMDETKGQSDDLNNDNDSSSSMWKFLEFLMGKKNDKNHETKIHYQNFLWWLSSPPCTTPTSFQSEKGPSEEDIWNEIVNGTAEKEERVDVKEIMTALWKYIVNPLFVEQSSSSTSSSSTKQSRIWSWFGYSASDTPKVKEQPTEADGIEKARELEEDTNTSTASSDNHIVWIYECHCK